MSIDESIAVVKKIQRKSVHQIVSEYRTKWFQHLGVSVVNHTDPEPYSCISQVTSRRECMLKITFIKPDPTPWDSSDKRVGWNSTRISYANMYDGRSRSRLRQIPMSKGIIDITDPRYKSLLSFIKTVVSSIALCNYLESWKINQTFLITLNMISYLLFESSAFQLHTYWKELNLHLCATFVFVLFKQKTN